MYQQNMNTGNSFLLHHLIKYIINDYIKDKFKKEGTKYHIWPQDYRCDSI